MSMQWAHSLICEARSLISSSSEWSSPQSRTYRCRPIIALLAAGAALRKSSRAFMAILRMLSVAWREQLLRLGAVHLVGEPVELAGGAKFGADLLDQRHHGERGARGDGDARHPCALEFGGGRRAGPRHDVDR